MAVLEDLQIAGSYAASVLSAAMYAHHAARSGTRNFYWGRGYSLSHSF